MALEIDGLGHALFCHGSPRSDEEILTGKTRPMAEEFTASNLLTVPDPEEASGYFERMALERERGAAS